MGGALRAGSILLCLLSVAGCGKLKLPAHTAWVHWTFPEAADELLVDVTIHDDPGDEVGLYFVPYAADIDGTGFYYGIQTDMYRPDVGDVGKGVIFSRWETRALEDLRIADGGYHQSAGYEGDFVGVRQFLDWSPGAYMLRLRRTEADGAADWFELTVTEASTYRETPVGALRFPRADPDVPARISAQGMAFTEVYGNARRPKDVPGWHVDLMPHLGGQAPLEACSEYPAFPYAEFEAADVWWEPERQRAHMAFGVGVERRHEPATLFP